MKSINKNNKLHTVFALMVVLAGAQFLTACSSSSGTAALTVAVANASLIEGNSGSNNLVFTLTFSAATGSASLAYATTDGTATTGDNDYTTTSGTLNITAGSTTATIEVPVTGDTTFEPDETFTLTLSSLTGLTATGSTLTATGTLTNDDNADNGYYTGSAIISVTAGNLTIDSPDLQAIVDTNKFVIVSVTDDLLYKGTFTTVNDTDYTADLRVYRNGSFLGLATVTGTHNSRSSLVGTMSGAGDYLSGNFNLTYGNINGRAPLAFIMSDQWGDGDPIGTSGYVLTINSNTDVTIEVFTPSPIVNLRQCDAVNTILNNVATEQAGRLRSFTTPGLINCTTVASDGRVFDGFLTTFDGGAADDTILFVSSDDADAIVVNMMKP